MQNALELAAQIGTELKEKRLLLTVARPVPAAAWRRRSPKSLAHRTGLTAASLPIQFIQI
jgi:hypothetical protein